MDNIVHHVRAQMLHVVSVKIGDLVSHVSDKDSLLPTSHVTKQLKYNVRQEISTDSTTLKTA